MSLRSRVLAVIVTAAATAAVALPTNQVVASPPGAGKVDIEPVSLSRLPLPPTAPSHEPGSCTAEINPNHTGCLDASRDGIDGTRSFSADGSSVFVAVRFAGAPAAPAAGSAYEGEQLILVKTDGTTFPGGDPWKCVTCGIPAENKAGANELGWDYPEAFRDGRRVKVENNILDCSPYRVVDAECTPQNIRVHAIKSPFPGFPAGGMMRETRLHPDNVHLGWNQLFFARDFRSVTQYGAFGRLNFVASPPSGAPHYELTKVSWLLGDLGTSGRFFSVDEPGQLSFDDPRGVIGEFRGFTPDGKEALGIGTQDSFNYDVFSTSLETGKSTRLTRDPAYTDPVHVAPDGKSLVLMDGRVDNRTGQPDGYLQGESGRTHFASGLPGVPPLIDLAISSAIGGFYNNEGRRFFEPYLVNYSGPYRNGVRDSNGGDGDEAIASVHDGQALNVGGDPTPGSGSFSDPLWNAGADPAWSPDGTSVVYFQRMVVPPACETPGTDEPACPVSREPGGRAARLMIARLTTRKPTPTRHVEPVADEIPWGRAYTPGDPLPPARPSVPAGSYRLDGRTGHADVVVTDAPSPFTSAERQVTSVTVTYHGYSADGVNVLDGTESGVRGKDASGKQTFTWHSDLVLSGRHTGTRKTSEPGGFTVTMSATLGAPPTIAGSLVTTLDGRTFRSPVTGS